MSNSLSAMIVDDEPLARLRLRQLLAEFPQLMVAGEAGSLAEARRLLDCRPIDLVFLDIDLFGEDGFNLLPDLPSATRVIFVTAYNSFAIRAFEVNALDYLLKPVEAGRLAESISRVRHPAETEAMQSQVDLSKDRFCLRDRKRVFIVRKQDIIAIFAEREYTRIFSEHHPPILIRKSLQSWTEELPAARFLRVHRHALVNLLRIQEIEELDKGITLRLRGCDQPVKVSNRLISLLKTRLLTR